MTRYEWRRWPGGMAAFLAAGTVLALAGFAGLDRWLYAQIGQRVNTGDPLSGDLYQSTKYAFLAARVAIYVVALGLWWVVIMHGTAAGRRRVLVSVMAAGLTAIVANMLQMGIGRARPNAAESHLAFHAPLSGLWQDNPDGFPSGEATAAFAVAYVLARQWPAWRGVWFALAMATAVARWLPGMHYLSDVAAGAVVGVGLTHVAYGVLRLGVRHWGRVLRGRPVGGIEPGRPRTLAALRRHQATALRPTHKAAGRRKSRRPADH